MHPKHHALMLLLLIATHAATTAPAFAQGSLNPPGAPAATMKTLQQIYDRIDLLLATVSNQQRQIDYLAASVGFNTAWTSNNVAPGTINLSNFAEAPDGRLGIAFINNTAPANISLAQYDGTSWSVEEAQANDGTGWNNVFLAYLTNGQPALAYTRANQQDLYFAFRSPGGAWTRRTIWSSGTPNFAVTGFGIGLGGVPTVGYRDPAVNILGVATTTDNGLNWSFDTVYTQFVFNSVFKIQPNGRPATVLLSTGVVNSLIYRYRGASQWFTETVASASSVSRPKDLTWTPGGFPAVVHQNIDASALYLSEWNGSAFVQRTIETSVPNDFGGEAGVAYGASAQPMVILGYSARPLGFYEWNGASWTKSLLSSNTMIERRIIVRPNGQPFVASRESSVGLTLWQRGIQP